VAVLCRDELEEEEECSDLMATLLPSIGSQWVQTPRHGDPITTSLTPPHGEGEEEELRWPPPPAATAATLGLLRELRPLGLWQPQLRRDRGTVVDAEGDEEHEEDYGLDFDALEPEVARQVRWVGSPPEQATVRLRECWQQLLEAAQLDDPEVSEPGSAMGAPCSPFTSDCQRFRHPRRPNNSAVLDRRASTRAVCCKGPALGCSPAASSLTKLSAQTGKQPKA
jgi:hypothetical protein